jgi:DNA sulfur modification protein DndB
MTIHNAGPYFYGDLVQNTDLDKIARERKNKYEEIVVPQSEVKPYLQQKWEIKRQIKNKVILKKEKEPDELLENEVWLLFKDMGFKEMNKDRNFKIQAGSSPKQIDVYARDENNIFVIFCTTNSSINIKDEVRKISDLKKDISLSIKNYYNKKFRVSFILVIKNIMWNEADEKLALTKGIFFWKDDDLEAYNMLVEQLSHAAKYQMYGLLFSGKKAFEVGEIEVPAMYSSIGGSKYYCFLIQPEKLFKIAYVHRREKSKPTEVRSSYQRMVNKKRLEKIGKFIDKGNSFPNNIILSFKRKPTFDPFKHQFHKGGIVYGILKFPKYYGCAWIIDGQHRLYGYSKSEHASNHTIPVIAFESLTVKDQANLFVDINKEQVAVPSNLLWDLYPDIYEGSEDERQKNLSTISLIAKKLNSDKESPLKGEIQIPSILTKEKPNLTLENVCRAIQENKLVEKDKGILYEENYEETINLASRVIETYFKEIAESFKEDWERGKKGLIRSNIGIRIFFILLKEVLRRFNYLGQENIYKKRDLNEFRTTVKELFTPLAKKVIEMSDGEKKRIRGSSSLKAVMNNAQQMAWWIKEQFEDFGLAILRNWAPQRPKEVTDDDIRKLLEDTEKNLRKLIIEKLKEKYGEKWWKQGVPEGVRKGIDKKIEDESKGESQLRKEELLSLSSERKLLGYSDTPHLREIIKFTPNWEFFQNIFIKDEDYTLSQFKSFEKVRNKYQHFTEHELYEDEKNLGFWGMKWIRRHVGLDMPKKILFSS